MNNDFINKLINDMMKGSFSLYESNPFKSMLPYNMVKNADETVTLEIAVAGYGADSLEVTLNDNVLEIVGKKGTLAEGARLLVGGIANRDFQTRFLVPSLFTVEDVNLKDGMLSIVFKKDEEFSKKVLPINTHDSSVKQLEAA